MINSRAKGHAYELQIVNRLKELGYDAVTSRSESKRMDDLGVDIIDNTDFYIQCKAVEKLKPSLHDILARMPTDKVPVVYHKRNNKGSIVSLKQEDFERLLLQTRDWSFFNLWADPQGATRKEDKKRELYYIFKTT